MTRDNTTDTTGPLNDSKQVELESITKRYKQLDGDDILAVDDLSLEIDKGEFLVLVGPSGCGKSTTLHCIAGLEEISEGTLRIDGKVVNDQTPEQRDIAMVFQNYALYPHMTAEENMGFGLKMVTDLSADKIKQRVEEVAELLGITDLLGDKPKALSGGQQQRVALGRAIVREPTVFLMDEPLSNLDAKLRTQMRTEIQELQSGLNVTTVYVTHDQTEAMTMGDRIAILNEGELQQVGTPLECYHQPVNQFVAGFIGEPSMNFFDMDYRDGKFVTEEFTFEPPVRVEEKIADSAEVVLGIRPEDIEIVQSESESTVTASVSVIEPMGDREHLHLDVAGKDVTATINENVGLDEGDSIHIRFPTDLVHVFDRATGESAGSPPLEAGDQSLNLGGIDK